MVHQGGRRRCSARSRRDLGDPPGGAELLSADVLDGERAASNTIRIKRGALRNALDFAVEKKLLTANPMNEVKTKNSSSSLAR
jgi:hypothetical protein